MGVLGNLLLIVFLAIGLTGIGVSTYLVGSDGKIRWLVYTIFSVVCIGLFLLFKYSTNTTLLFCRQAFLMMSFYAAAVCTLMAFIAIPKTSLKALKESIVPAVSVFAIGGILLMIF